MSKRATQDSAAERTTPEVRYRIADRIAYITIDRPEARNAINPAVRRALIESFSDASINPDVWIVVLTGSGDRAFCAGGDLKNNNESAKAGKRHVMPMTGRTRTCTRPFSRPTSRRSRR